MFSGDKPLLDACLRGEPGAWEEFVRRYSRLVYWSINRTLDRSRFAGRTDLAADLFQDSFRKIFDRKEMLRLDDPAGVKKFLVVLAANLTLDRLKALSREEGRSVFIDAAEEGAPAFESLESPGAGPADMAHAREKEAVVAGVLETLSPKERACLEMSVFDGRSHREIGLVLGLPQDTVSSLVRRTKEKVRQKLVEKGLSG